MGVEHGWKVLVPGYACEEPSDVVKRVAFGSERGMLRVSLLTLEVRGRSIGNASNNRRLTWTTVASIWRWNQVLFASLIGEERCC
jgi:hypothetical protein